jgi:alpha/beta superfamily hydrolase
VVPGANHFFQDQQDVIARHVTEYLRKAIAAPLDQVAE